MEDSAVGVKKLSRAAGSVPERIQANPSGRVSNVSLADVGAEEHRLRRAVTARFGELVRRRSTLLFLGGRGVMPTFVADARDGGEGNDGDSSDPAGPPYHSVARPRIVATG